MGIPSNMTIEQADAIENGIAVLHTCVRAAVSVLEENEEGQIAFGLQNACRDFEKALKTVWGEDKPCRPTLFVRGRA